MPDMRFMLYTLLAKNGSFFVLGQIFFEESINLADRYEGTSKN
jgi:hypothetical protein